ncbi:MAG: S-layer homology domain-containing protein [Syntrophomonadaceae bacterium]
MPEHSNDNDKTSTTNHWARGSIEIASALGISRGSADGSFQPDAPITRE